MTLTTGPRNALTSRRILLAMGPPLPGAEPYDYMGQDSDTDDWDRAWLMRLRDVLRREGESYFSIGGRLPYE